MQNRLKATCGILAATLIFAACGNMKNGLGEGGDSEEGSFESGTAGSTTGDLSTTGGSTATGTNSAGQTVTLTNTIAVSVSPATVTTTSTPSFSWAVGTPAYKIYVTKANSSTILWGLMCSTASSNCIASPVNYGDTSAGAAAATKIGTATTATLGAAGGYTVYVETSSAQGTIAQAGWTAFTVQ